jgi:uncharacterized protein YecE (DUF72 family)
MHLRGLAVFVAVSGENGAVYWIGTSGWSYQHWKQRFYPAKMPSKDWLAYYSKHFETVEINATFYRLQQAQTFNRWATAVPDGFRFAFKASRYLTHTRRLQESSDGLARLLDSTAPLGKKRGPMLLQLPPRFASHPERLATFLETCPDDLDVAVEFRDPTWFNAEIEDVLYRFGAALVWSDYPGAQSPDWNTAPFLYVRRHGAAGKFYGRYGRPALERLAAAMSDSSRDAYCFFNNDADGAAVLDALELGEIIHNRG